MPTILETALQMLAGASFAPSVVFLWFWLKQRHELEYFWSALLGFGATGYICCSVLEYSAPDLPSYLQVLRWQPMFSSLVPGCLLQLVLAHRKQASLRLKLGLHSLAGLVFVIGFVRVANPELTFRAVRLHPFDLAGGLGHLQLLEVQTTAWSIPIWVALFGSLAIGLVVNNLVGRTDPHGKDPVLNASIAVLFIAAIHDTFAVALHFPWPYLTEPAMSMVTLLQARRLHTDLLHTQALRREMEARTEMFGLLFRQNPLACIVSRHEDGKILLANPRFIHLVAAESEKAILGRTSLEIGLWKDTAERENELLSLLKHGQGKCRTVWRRLDGSTVHVSHSVQKIQYEGTDCILVMAEDIEQEARAEMALRESEARTRDLNAELERRVDQRTRDMQAALDELESFTYSVSHDLRSPLRAIDGFALALVEDCSQDLGPAANANIVRIRKASKRMSALIDDLLSLYRSSRVFVARTNVDISSLADDLMRKLSKSHSDRNVHWTVQQGIAIHADAALTGIAMEHLLDNSWKFTLRAASPEIHIDTMVEDGKTWIRIRDNGEGFDMAHAGNLFRTFHRLHDEAEFEGNGIGLAIVKRVVTRHGGRIEVDSKPGAGSEFRFCLQESIP